MRRLAALAFALFLAPTLGLAALRAALPAADVGGQGGLLDVALDPRFAANRLVYWSAAATSTPPARAAPNSARCRRCRCSSRRCGWRWASGRGGERVQAC
jgi:hypothetical protein